jgi:hypothetical protein
MDSTSTDHDVVAAIVEKLNKLIKSHAKKPSPDKLRAYSALIVLLGAAAIAAPLIPITKGSPHHGSNLT